MAVQIRSAKSVGKEHHLGILVQPDQISSLPQLSGEEKAYAIKKAENKDKVFLLPQFPRMVIVHLIESNDDSARPAEELRLAGARMQGIAVQEKIGSLYLVDATNNLENLLLCAEGMALANYQFIKYQTKGEEKKFSLREIVILHPSSVQSQITELQHLLDAVYYARDLVNEPVSHLNAQQLAEAIQQMGQEAGFQVEVLQKKQIESLRMGGLLAVNRGSVDPPTFSILEWKPAKAKNSKPYLLVGKGVVYDTGGLSLKPTQDSMDYMKTDMSGAAAVACTLYALAKNKIPLHVIALVPATDNRPGGNAYAPGDVITMFDQSTVEVLNSDAEGRMILADALAYGKSFDPVLGITVATLTGAASRAIGKRAMVGMGNAPRTFFDPLIDSGFAVHERIAEFPFWEDYGEMIKSSVADIQNIGGADAGAITGGKFLECFTSYPFIHLDIAGPAWFKSTDGYRVKGGTGIGVRLLYHFLKSQAEKE